MNWLVERDARQRASGENQLFSHWLELLVERFEAICCLLSSKTPDRPNCSDYPCIARYFAAECRKRGDRHLHRIARWVRDLSSPGVAVGGESARSPDCIRRGSDHRLRTLLSSASRLPYHFIPCKFITNQIYR